MNFDISPNSKAIYDVGNIVIYDILNILVCISSAGEVFQMGGSSWTLNTGVGMLTHNIRIRADPTSSVSEARFYVSNFGQAYQGRLILIIHWCAHFIVCHGNNAVSFWRQRILNSLQGT